jgi:hypothetical protein
MSDETIPNVQTNEQSTPEGVQTNEQKTPESPEVPIVPPGSTTPESKTEPKDGVQKAVEKAARKLKIKVDGVTEEYDEEDVIKMAQLSKASQKRFNEAAATKKEAAKILEKLKENPLEVLQHPDIGVDVKKFAEDYLIKEMEKAELSPEARRAYEAEQKVAAMEKEKEERLKQETEAQQMAAQKQWATKYETDIQAALEKTAIPKTPQSVKRMVMYMLDAVENKVDMSAEQAAQVVRNDYSGDTQTLYSQMDGETLISVLGEEVATKIRKADLARLEAKLNPKTPEGEVAVENVTEGMPRTTQEEANRKPMNSIEWREYMDKLRNS